MQRWLSAIFPAWQFWIAASQTRCLLLLPYLPIKQLCSSCREVAIECPCGKIGTKKGLVCERRVSNSANKRFLISLFVSASLQYLQAKICPQISDYNQMSFVLISFPMSMWVGFRFWVFSLFSFLFSLQKLNCTQFINRSSLLRPLTLFYYCSRRTTLQRNFTS